MRTTTTTYREQQQFHSSSSSFQQVSSSSSSLPHPPALKRSSGEYGASVAGPATATASASASTTTLSTISVQSGDARMVVAVLMQPAANRIDIKLVEAIPGPGRLGVTFAEAAALKDRHERVVADIRAKQSPVEELLAQADHLIASQKPRAEVYAAMAQSLGTAWKDLNVLLDQRQQILQANYLFLGHFQDYKDKACALERECGRPLPSASASASSVRAALASLLSAKRAMLETSSYALQEGEAAANALNAAAKTTSTVCWPGQQGQIRRDINLAIGQIELWLEELHDRRVSCTALFDERRRQLQLALSRCPGDGGPPSAPSSPSSPSSPSLSAELRELSALLSAEEAALSAWRVDLGASVSSCERRVTEAVARQARGQQIADRCCSLVRNLDHSSASTETSTAAYALTDRANALVDAIEQRMGALANAANFFQTARGAEYRLDQLETSARRASAPPPDLGQQLDEAVCDALDAGRRLVGAEGRGPGSQGVLAAMQHLGDRVANIRDLSRSREAQAALGSQAVDTFAKKLQELEAWLRSVDAFLESERRLSPPEKFLQAHRDQANRLHMKSYELDGLREALKALSSSQPGDGAAAGLEGQMGGLKARINDCLERIARRVAAAESLDKFEKLRAQLQREMTTLETGLAQKGDQTERLSETKSLVQLLFSQTKGQASQVGASLRCERELLLDEDVDEAVARLAERQRALMEQWAAMEARRKDGRRVEEEWGRIDRDKRESLDVSLRLDDELFPILRGAPMPLHERPAEVCAYLEDRLLKLPKHHLVEERLAGVMARAEEMVAAGKMPQGQKEDDARKMVAELKEKLKVLQVLFGDYELILQMLVPFFKNFTDLHQTMKTLMMRYKQSGAPSTITDAELFAREHEANRASLSEVLRFARRERDAVSTKMCEVRSKQLLRGDRQTLESVIERAEEEFDRCWQDRKEAIARHARFCLFAGQLKSLTDDLQQVHTSIKLKTTFPGEARGATDAALRYIADQVEGSELPALRKRMDACKSDGAKLAEDTPAHEVTINMGIEQLNERWEALLSLIEERKTLAKAAREYFALQEQTEAFLKESNKSLLAWSREASEGDKSGNTKKRILAYIEANQERQSTTSERLVELAVKAFGQAGYGQAQSVQSDIREVLEALKSLLRRMEEEEVRKRQEAAGEGLRVKREAEAEKSLRAAKAQAEAAGRAAQKAEEAARRAKEEAERKAKADQSHKLQQEQQQQAHRAPQFRQHLEDVVVDANSSCRLVAKVMGMPEPKITWFRDGEAVAPGGNIRRESGPGGQCSLTVARATQSANWSVRAANSAGFAESHAKMTVRTKKEAPAFYVPLRNVEVAEGHELTMECAVTGAERGEAEVTWFRNNVPLTGEDGAVASSKDNVYRITLAQVKIKQAGEYKVRVTNAQGSCQSTCTLTVKPRNRQAAISTQTSINEQPPKKQQQHHQNQKLERPSTQQEEQRQPPDERPHFARTPDPTVSAFEGQPNLVLAVTLQKNLSQDHQQVEWIKDGKKITSGQSPNWDRFTITREGDTCYLIISNVQAGDGGMYVARAFNASGDQACAVKVKVIRQPQQAPTTAPPAASSTAEPKSSASIRLGNQRETRALRILAEHRYEHRRPLPQLEPFPFKPDDPRPPRKNRGKVPKPSKFVPGEMYHSDYESDLEGLIPAKWRACYSDTEDDAARWGFRRVKPELGAGLTPQPRRPSPPCPHKWESHDAIEALERELRKPMGQTRFARRNSDGALNAREKWDEQAAMTQQFRSLTRSRVPLNQETDQVSSNAAMTQLSKVTRVVTKIETKSEKNTEGASIVPQVRQDPQFLEAQFSVEGIPTLEEVSFRAPGEATNSQMEEDQDGKELDLEERRQQTKDIRAMWERKTSKTWEDANAPSGKGPTSGPAAPVSPWSTLPRRKKQLEHPEYQTMPTPQVQHQWHQQQFQRREESDQSAESQRKSFSEIRTSFESAAKTGSEGASKLVLRPVTPELRTSSLLTTPTSPGAAPGGGGADETSFSSQSTAVTVVERRQRQKEKFVSVREKVKILEQKVEEADSRQEETDDGGGGGGGEGGFEEAVAPSDTETASAAAASATAAAPIRPEDIPGAVRVLPTGRRSPFPFHQQGRSNSALDFGGLRGHSSSRHRSSSVGSSTNSLLCFQSDCTQSPLPTTSPLAVGRRRLSGGGNSVAWDLPKLQPFPFQPGPSVVNQPSVGAGQIQPPSRPSKFVPAGGPGQKFNTWSFSQNRRFLSPQSREQSGQRVPNLTAHPNAINNSPSVKGNDTERLCTNNQNVNEATFTSEAAQDADVTATNNTHNQTAESSQMSSSLMSVTSSQFEKSWTGGCGGGGESNASTLEKSWASQGNKVMSASWTYHHHAAAGGGDGVAVESGVTVPHDGGYEADTDDTLRRRKGSVKELTRAFETSVEEGAGSSNCSQPNTHDGFVSSAAYQPPGWQEEAHHYQTRETKIIRFNQQELLTSDIPHDYAETTTNSSSTLAFSDNFGSVPQPSHEVLPTDAASSVDKAPPPVFSFKKFVPRSGTDVAWKPPSN